MSRHDVDDAVNDDHLARTTGDDVTRNDVVASDDDDADVVDVEVDVVMFEINYHHSTNADSSSRCLIQCFPD